jgi:hypothetical protein
MKRKNQTHNIWTAEDEQKHLSSALEWWSLIGFFTSKEDQKHWSLKTVFTEGGVDREHFDSLSNTALFDEDTQQHYVYLNRKLKTELQSRPDVFDIRQDESSIKGAYPTYSVHLHNPEHDIDIDITLHAESRPYWVAQEATNGWLPMGLGFFRYGFIPKVKISGTLKIKGKTFTIEGTGYYEHIWGSFSFRSPLSHTGNLKKTISIYSRLLVWWLQNQKPRIPSSLMFNSENNPLGYDWAWAVLDNGWTIFYGNILSWLMEGPATGVLILSKDGKYYTEFGSISFRYLKTTFAKSYDFVYPTEFEITAVHEKETIHLRFTMTAECREYISRFPRRKYWLGFVTCESPGKIVGYYQNDSENVPLSGKCKIEPQRQASIIGHNTLRIDLLKPPRGVGVSVEFDSHYFGKKMTAQLRFFPKPLIRFSSKRVINPNSKPVTK